MFRRGAYCIELGQGGEARSNAPRRVERPGVPPSTKGRTTRISYRDWGIIDGKECEVCR